MTRFTFATAATLLAFAQLSLAQDPRAETDLDRNRPTKTWTQWQPKATYAINELPDQYMGANRIESGEGGQPGGEPQSGYNTCAKDTWSQDSRCQTAWINSLEDFCIWGPAEYGTVGEKERSGVAYCTTDKHGTRLIPDGTITGAHFVRTKDYVQVTGVGDFTSINIPAGDDGGEFDPHGADDLGNPIGGILYTTANPATGGEAQQQQEWSNFQSHDQFCIRACWGPDAARQCEHIYDVMGCRWNFPANYDAGVFESCEGDTGLLAGIYGSSTFRQGDASTPPAHPAPSSSQCKTVSTISHGLPARSLGIAASSSSSASAAATSTGSTASSSTAPTSGLSSRSNNVAEAAATNAGSAASAAGQNTGTSGASHAYSLPLVSSAVVGVAALALLL